MQAECNYSVYDRELLAIVDALKHWRHYLLAPVEPTLISTDHQNLLYFKNPRFLKPRHARGAEFLSQFPFEIAHIKGEANKVADALSRMDKDLDRSSTDLVVLPERCWVSALELNSFRGMDEWPEEIRYFLDNDKWRNELSEKELAFLNKEIKNFRVQDGKVYHTSDSGGQLYVPKDERDVIMKRYHVFLGHMSTSSIMQLVSRFYWWPTQERDLRSFIQRCPQCQLNRSHNKNSLATPPLRPVPPVALPFERWGMDFVGILPETKQGNKYIITAIDYATRWVIALPVPNMNSSTVASFLYTQIVMNHGGPLEIITDRGKSFLAEGIAEYERRIGVHHIATTPHHPQTNGMVERMHAMLNHAITTLSDAQRERWDEFLPMTLFAIRVRRHATTNFSPFYLLYGVEPRLPVDPRPPPNTLQPLDEIESLDFQTLLTARELDSLGNSRAAAYKRTLVQAEQMKRRFNIQDENDTHYFEEGQMVKLKHWDKQKFEFKWKGPFFIGKLGKPGTYWLLTPRGDFLESTINQSDLAPWLATTTANESYFYDGRSSSTTQAASFLGSEPVLSVSGSDLRREDSVKPH